MMMENFSGFGKEDDQQMDLPPGFRFHPTDEELITHYLIKKVVDNTFSAKAIGEVDMNRIGRKSSVQTLPKSAKNEWVIFRVFHKGSGEKKLNIPGTMTTNSGEMEHNLTPFPPLTDTSPPYSGGRVIKSDSLDVPCFSNSTGYSFPGQEQSILKGLIKNNGFQLEKEMGTGSQETGLSNEMNIEISSVMSNLEMGKRALEDQEAPLSTSVGPIDMECLWNY